jgi:DNA-binding ferritin-like protein (Dps family)
VIMGISEIAAKLVGDKQRWRAYKARVRELPEPYRTAVSAIERYLTYTGPSDVESLTTMLEDLADLFEQGAPDTPVRDIVGDDPVEFAEAFKRNYGLGSWLSKEQRRLVDGIESAEREQEPTP